MSFREIPSGISIVNRALGMIGESNRIASFDDPGNLAKVASRWYKPVVARLLEMHHWGLATKHQSMIAVDNLRANEWSYAYAPPSDMAFPVGVGLTNGASTVSYYRGLGSLLGMILGRPVFQYQNGVIYSNLGGDLEYVSYDITEASFNATFEDIIILMLASRFALEIPKDREMSEDFAKQATTAINVAMAQNLNAGNRKYGAIASEAEVIRGEFPGYRSWDYFPGSVG